MKKIIFVANSTKRYRYYKLLANRNKALMRVIFPIYPTFSLLIGFFKNVPIDKDLLLSGHLRRQKINYPLLSKYDWLWRTYCFLAYVTECARFHHYYSIFNKLDCEALGLWNGQKQPYLTMVKAAEFANKRVLFFENGLLPNTTTADYSGVNAYNSLPRNPNFYLNLSTTESAGALPRQLLKRTPHKKRKSSRQVLNNLNFKYIFIPFQVPADSQVVLNSPWIHSMEQLFQLVRKTRNQLQQDGGGELPYLVFKEHPSWPGHFEDLYDIDEYCLFANENDTQALIENAEAVITINSTVGLESLLLGKKVITLGEACYNIEQLVLHAKNESEFNTYFANLPSWHYNETLRLTFIHFIASIYCIPNDWQNMLTQCDEEHVQAIHERIFEIDVLAKHLEDNKQY
jgi:capsular polysaccharide export protein